MKPPPSAIALAIHRSGKKQCQIARECGITDAYLSEIKYGIKRGLTPAKVQALSQALSVSVEWLIAALAPASVPALRPAPPSPGLAPRISLATTTATPFCLGRFSCDGLSAAQARIATALGLTQAEFLRGHGRHTDGRPS